MSAPGLVAGNTGPTSAPGLPSSPARRAALFALAFGIVLVGLAAPGLDNHFWSEEAEFLRSAAEALSDPSAIARLQAYAFFPVTRIVVAAQVAVLGDSPAAVHGFDLALHVLNGILLAALFGRWLSSPVPAALAAGAWMISRHTSEAVFWMGTRQHSLAFLFAMISLHAMDRRRPVLAGVALVLAAWSKEVGLFALPIAALRLLALSPTGSPSGRAFYALRGVLPLAVASAFAYAVRAVVVSGTTGTGLPPAGILGADSLQKYAYYLLQYSELTMLPWQSPVVPVLAIALVLAVFARGSALARVGLAWTLVSLLPFLLLPKFSPRYSLFPYAGFLLLVSATWCALSAPTRRRIAAPAAIAYALLMLFQAYVVFLDERDHDMRSRFVERLAADYARVAPDIADGPLAIRPVSGVDVQPLVNALCRVPKPNAPIPDGLWGILPAEDLVGMVELTRGRVWRSAADVPAGAPILVHTGERFVVESFTGTETGVVIAGRLDPR